MNYEQAETDIVTRLTPYAAAGIIDVTAVPQTQAEFKRPLERGKITVSFKGSKFKDPASTAEMSQDEEVMFQITLQSIKFRGPGGIYQLMQIALQSLVGFQPTDCDSLYAKESGMTGIERTFQDGVWTYDLILCARSVAVFDFEEDVSVTLNKVTTSGPFGDPPIVVTGDSFDYIFENPYIFPNNNF